MSQLHITATIAALLMVVVFGLTNYLLDGRPFHAPIPSAYWADETNGGKFVTLDDVKGGAELRPVAHTPR